MTKMLKARDKLLANIAAQLKKAGANSPDTPVNPAAMCPSKPKAISVLSKPAKKPKKQIAWTSRLAFTVANASVGAGLHLKKGQKGLDSEWEKVKVLVMNQPTFAEIKADTDQLALYTTRKIKDKFWIKLLPPWTAN